MKAIWNNQVIAESNDTIVIENNHYFPPESVNQGYLKPSDHTTHCPWKGDASYYHVVVDSQSNDNAAWFYPNPKPEAEHFRDYIAFWKQVDVID